MFSSTWVMSISLTQLLLGRDQDGSSGGGACFALHSDDTYGDFRLAAYMVLLSFSNTFITFTIVFPLLGCWLLVVCHLGRRNKTAMHTDT